MFNYIPEEIFEVYACKEKNIYKHFSFSDKIYLSVGKKKEDFIKIKLKIKEIIDINKDKKEYRNMLCGFYDFKENNIYPSTIFNSFLLTCVCFPYDVKYYHNISGIFVILEILDN